MINAQRRGHQIGAQEQLLYPGLQGKALIELATRKHSLLTAEHYAHIDPLSEFIHGFCDGYTLTAAEPPQVIVPAS